MLTCTVLDAILRGRLWGGPAQLIGGLRYQTSSHQHHPYLYLQAKQFCPPLVSNQIIFKHTYTHREPPQTVFPLCSTQYDTCFLHMCVCVNTRMQADTHRFTHTHTPCRYKVPVGISLSLSPSLMPQSHGIQPPLFLHPLRLLCVCVRWLLNQEGIVSLQRGFIIERSHLCTHSNGC